jgi:hypothetical protein
MLYNCKRNPDAYDSPLKQGTTNDTAMAKAPTGIEAAKHTQLKQAASV